MVVRDPAAAEQLAEVLRAEEVALDLVLEVLLPVEADRAGDVRLGVERRVLVDLDDADRVVAQVVLDPLGVDKDVLGVVGHVSSISFVSRAPFGYFTFRLLAGVCSAPWSRRRFARPPAPPGPVDPTDARAPIAAALPAPGGPAHSAGPGRPRRPLPRRGRGGHRHADGRARRGAGHGAQPAAPRLVALEGSGWCEPRGAAHLRSPGRGARRPRGAAVLDVTPAQLPPLRGARAAAGAGQNALVAGLGRQPSGEHPARRR